MYKKVIVIVLLVFLSSMAFCDSPDDMWNLFLKYPDSAERAELLIKIGALGKADRNIIDNINNYLVELNSLVSSGESVDYSMVSACITAIMELNDSSSYPVLFAAMCAGYPEVIASEAYGALDFIDGDLFRFLSGVITNNPPMEKFTAFKASINSIRLNVSERGQLAELALEQALAANEESADLTAMRYAAVLALTSFRWTRANALAIDHYYRIREDNLHGRVSKSRYIEAIACLGAVGNTDAALALGLQLGLINARAERTGAFDAEITLAVIQALGSIGANAVFDHLLHVNSISYPRYIRTAAREAIDRLKW